MTSLPSIRTFFASQDSSDISSFTPTSYQLPPSPTPPPPPPPPPPPSSFVPATCYPRPSPPSFHQPAPSTAACPSLATFPRPPSQPQSQRIEYQHKSIVGRISDTIAENRRDLEYKCNLLDLGPSKTQIFKAPIVGVIVDSHFIRWIVGDTALWCIVLDYSSRSVKKSCDMFYSLLSVEQHHRYRRINCFDNCSEHSGRKV